MNRPTGSVERPRPDGRLRRKAALHAGRKRAGPVRGACSARYIAVRISIGCASSQRLWNEKSSIAASIGIWLAVAARGSS